MIGQKEMKLSDWSQDPTCCWTLSHRRLLQAASPHPGDDDDDNDDDDNGNDDNDDNEVDDIYGYDDDNGDNDDVDCTWSVSNVCLSSVVSTFNLKFKI